MLEDIKKFQLKRVNPFQGLVIDADTWRDAHNYNQDWQRLHTLLFHEVGIIEGLGVTANNPPDISVVIQSGVAIDPQGNIIIVPQPQQYRIETRKKGTVFLIIQFREVPAGPYQPPDGGQATRILEAYRIQEREKPPDEPYLELGRVELDPAEPVIRNASRPATPGRNEINLNFRKETGKTATVAPVKATPVPERTLEKVATSNIVTITMGRVVLGGASADLHAAGFANLAKEVSRQNNVKTVIKGNASIENMGDCSVIYLTGNSSFEISSKQKAALSDLLTRGGVIFGEACADGETEPQSRKARDFGLAFNQLANELKCKLEMVQRGHSLLSSVNIFSEVPPGAEPKGMLLEGGRMVYSSSDYGCAWQGGSASHALPREIIRSSLEMGVNIVGYSQLTK